jgi:ubiquinone/menaquinone biosynthesis C-methylase UbiE
VKASSFIPVRAESVMPAAPSADEARTARVVAMLQPHISGSVLDVGCYNGAVTRQLSPDAVGIDVVAPPKPQVSVTVFDGRDIPFPDQSFDTVVCSFVLHHSPDPARLLVEMKRVGKRLVILEDAYDNFADRSVVIATHWIY